MKTFLAVTLLLIALTACAPAADEETLSPVPTRTGVLAPYSGPDPSGTPSPTNLATNTPLPTPTPTPRTHVVKAKEDLWGIAWRYGLSLEDLLTANPTVDPRFLSIGAELKIPAPLYTPTPDADNPPLPTPVGMALEDPYCYPSQEGGLWCFTTAENRQDYSIEALSAVLQLYDLTTGEIHSETAYAPLNQVPPGGTMVLAAYFPAPIPQNFVVTAELFTALPVPPDSGRFLAVQQPETDVEISADGKSALVSGYFKLSEAQAEGSRIAAAAIAYDADNMITGFRQWESLEPFNGADKIEFEFTVYAAGAPIDRVVVLTEAYP